MTWVRIDEEMAKHPKIAALSAEAFREHITGLCYCNAYLTDGLLPVGVVRKRYANELVSAGVWTLSADGYEVHDFHDYQPSRAEVLELREKRSQAGKKGGRKSKPPSKRSSKSEASASASDQAKPEAKPNPVPEPVPTKETLPAVASPGERARNPGWDGLAAVFGYSPTSDQERKLWGRLSAQLNAAGASEDSVTTAASRYRSDMREATLTPTALVKHYERLMAAPAVPNGRPLTTAQMMALTMEGGTDDRATG